MLNSSRYISRFWGTGYLSFFILILLITLLRLAFLHQELYTLYADEAQYWFWSLTPDWGYYSKPPVIAWLIALTTRLGDDSAFYVRLAAPILHGLTALVVYTIGKTLYDRQIGVWSGLLYATMPAVTLSSGLISTDVPLLFFWSLAFLGFIRAVKSDHWRWWLLTGLAAGLGMLSKYSMLFFAFSVLLATATVPNVRAVWRLPKYYVALVVALLCFLPNVIWNFQHGLVTFLHTQDNANLNQSLLHPGKFLEFFGAQFGVFGPLLFGTLLCLMATWRRQNDPQLRLLLSFVAPFLGTICVIALLSRAHANWAAPAYATATIAVVAWALQQNKRWILVVSLALNIVMLAVFMNYHHFNISSYRYDPFYRIRGWDQLGEQVRSRLQQHPDAQLLTDDRKTMATLLYYAKPEAATAVKWNGNGKIEDHFELTTQLTGSRFVLVTRNPQPTAILREFTHSEILAPIAVTLYNDYTLEYYCFYLSRD